MKRKVIVFLAISAALTLSFTFGSTKTENHSDIKVQAGVVASEPVGGIISEDQL